MNPLLNTLVLCIEGFWRQVRMVFFSGVLLILTALFPRRI